MHLIFKKNFDLFLVQIKEFLMMNKSYGNSVVNYSSIMQ